MTNRPLDLIAVGRCMVDLYCDQIGSPISQGQSLSMYIGGCPTNVAVGSRRQGLRVAMLTRVGADATGEFVIATFAREGVDTSHIHRDPDHITPMVVAGIAPGHFPLTWYRERTTDLALSTDDYDETFVGSSQAILISGNSLSTEPAAKVVRHLVDMARRLGTKVIYDIDYRGMLWHKLNPDRTAGEVAHTLQSILPSVDLLVGTEEEYEALLNLPSAEIAFQQARSLGHCLAVMKLGKLGALVAPAGEPARSHSGFPVPVYNTLGAGDAFLSGFLAAWLRGRDVDQCARQGNASGALVVTRHGCSPAMPYQTEIERFTANDIPNPRLDVELNRLHAAGLTLPPHPPMLLIGLDEWIEDAAGEQRKAAAHSFRRLVLTSLEKSRLSLGFLIGTTTDLTSRDDMLRHPARLFETMSKRQQPLAFHGPGGDPGLALRERPRFLGINTRLQISLAESAEQRLHRLALLTQLQASVATWDRTWMIELVAEKGDLTAIMADLMTSGLTPRYWQLPSPIDSSEWQQWRDLLGPSGCQIFLPSAAGSVALAPNDPLWAGVTVGSEMLSPCLDALLAGEPDRDVCELLKEVFHHSSKKLPAAAKRR